MSTETVTSTVDTPVETPDVDLDTFADELFGRSEPAPETTNSEEAPDNAEVTDVTEATEVTEEEAQDETPEATENTEEEAPKPKPSKKPSAQERISQVISERNAERQRVAELQAKLAALENPKQNTEPTSTATAPTSDALNEDGSPKYPLGDFDPNYIRDLTTFNVQTQLAEQRKIEEAAKAEAEAKVQQQALAAEWNEKLTPALERYPDFQEKGQELLESLSGLDSDYEDYIAATIMQLEYGPDVLYYLSSNPNEAQAIVNAGPTKAAVLLGRLESKFLQADAEKTLARPKVSKAPTPPPINKGSSAVKASVAPDTDDLEAFEKELFRKK